MLHVDIGLRRGEFHLDAAFESERGSITGLYGQSGAGKTSLVNAIAGLTRPERGRIAFDGQDLFDAARNINRKPESRRIGYVFQEGRLFPHMTVRGNLLYGHGKVTGGPDLDQVVALLDIAPLLHRKPKGLSGGERQRVAIGRALLADPDIFLMDEPLAAIDIGRRNEILPFIERLRDEFGKTVIYVSHALDEVIRLADNMVILADGRIAAQGSVEDLMSRPDLYHLTDYENAGAVLSTRFAGFEPEYGLATLAFAGGTLRLSGVDLPPGTPVRAQIRARDVSLMLSRPENTSVLNIFEGVVTAISESSAAQADVMLDIGSPLAARITRKSLHELGLKTGSRVFALVKAVSIDKRSLGRNG